MNPIPPEAMPVVEICQKNRTKTEIVKIKKQELEKLQYQLIGLSYYGIVSLDISPTAHYAFVMWVLKLKPQDIQPAVDAIWPENEKT